MVISINTIHANFLTVIYFMKQYCIWSNICMADQVIPTWNNFVQNVPTSSLWTFLETEHKCFQENTWENLDIYLLLDLLPNRESTPYRPARKYDHIFGCLDKTLKVEPSRTFQLTIFMEWIVRAIMDYSPAV